MSDAATTPVVTPVNGVAAGGYLDFIGMSVQGITHALFFGSAEMLLATDIARLSMKVSGMIPVNGVCEPPDQESNDRNGQNLFYMEHS